MRQILVAFVVVLDGVQEVLAVRVIVEDGLHLVPAGGHMIDCAGYSMRRGRAMEGL